MLPEGWAGTTLGEIGTWGSGGTPKASEPSFYGGSIPWVRSGDLPDGLIEGHEATITDEGLKNSAAKWVPPGSVLIAMYGATIGKVGLSTYSVTTNQAVAFVKPSEQISERFLFASLKASKAKFIELGQGGAQPNISQEILKRQPINLPPLAEQRRIVAKLDALTARLARARAELEWVPSLAALLRLKTLREAFFWGAPHAEIPEGWSYQRVDQIGSVQLGRQRSPKDHSGPNMRPYVRAANITWMGWELSDVKEMNFSDIEFSSYHLEPGDVLLNEGSGSPSEVGKPAVWRGEIEDVCFQNTLLRVRPRGYNPDLLRYCFLYMALSGHFVEDTRGVNIAHIGKAGLASKVIPVPPIGNQSAILSSIEQSFARADRLEAEAARARALLDRLEAAILAKAFRGELVPQDPTEEPASALLDRIRAERAAAPKPKRGCRAQAPRVEP